MGYWDENIVDCDNYEEMDDCFDFDIFDNIDEMNLDFDEMEVEEPYDFDPEHVENLDYEEVEQDDFIFDIPDDLHPEQLPNQDNESFLFDIPDELHRADLSNPPEETHRPDEPNSDLPPEGMRWLHNGNDWEMIYEDDEKQAAEGCYT